MQLGLAPLRGSARGQLADDARKTAAGNEAAKANAPVVQPGRMLDRPPSGPRSNRGGGVFVARDESTSSVRGIRQDLQPQSEPENFLQQFAGYNPLVSVED